MASCKRRSEAILFDLDGTLLDTLEDLARCMNRSLEHLGFETHSVEAYKHFVGDGTEEMAQRALPAGSRDELMVRKCIQQARQQYSQSWGDYTKPYAGIPQLLDGLVGQGIPMTILSNKPDDFTQEMVAELLKRWRFEIVRGASGQRPIKPDPAAALQIAEELAIPPERFVYLGDTNTDMKTANSAGMFAVGALWGFRTAEELTDSGAKILVSRPEEVLNLFNSQR